MNDLHREIPDSEVQQYIGREFNRKPKRITSYLQVAVIIALLIFMLQLRGAVSVISEDVKGSTVYVHDTVTVQEKHYFCFKCNAELTGLKDGPVDHCGIHYTLSHGELVAKKLEQ